MIAVDDQLQFMIGDYVMAGMIGFFELRQFFKRSILLY